MISKLPILIYLQETNLELQNILNKIKQFQIHEINKNRQVFGEYHHLFPLLKVYPDKFFNYNRMSIPTFNYILFKIQNSLLKNWCNYHQQPILPEEKLVITLRFLATGLSYSDLSFTFRVGRSTISIIIKEVMQTLWNKLLPIHMPVPTQHQFLRIAQDFYEITGFPHCVGAIDCQHIQIKKPANSGSKYFNYKKYFSIVLQAAVDAHCKFITIDVGGFGQQSDGGTFQGSSLYAALKSGKIKFPPNNKLPNSQITLAYFLVGDGAYPLMENLMKPYPGQQLPAYAEIFNKRLSRARVCVERAFGLVSQKWRIFYKKIAQNPETVNLIVKCTCLLHNIIIDKENIINLEYEHNMVDIQPNAFIGDDRENEFVAGYGREVRQELTKWILKNPIN